VLAARSVNANGHGREASLEALARTVPEEAIISAAELSGSASSLSPHHAVEGHFSERKRGIHP
jgi:hypothetical protein